MSIEPYEAAVVQSSVEVVCRPESADRDQAANVAELVRWIDFLCKGNRSAPRLIVFPVLTLVGASRRDWFTTDMPLDLTGDRLEPLLLPLMEACARYDCYVVTSTVEKHAKLPGHLFHSGFMLGPQGVVLRQPKVQARSSSKVTVLNSFAQGYLAAMGPDSLQTVVETPIGRIGCIVEAEGYVPEVSRGVARKGAEIIVHPNLDHGSRLRAIRALKQSIALQNGVYLLSANMAFERMDLNGEVTIAHMDGGSLIVGPDGEVLAICDTPGVSFAIATIDLEKAAKTRARNEALTQPTWGFYSHIYRDE